MPRILPEQPTIAQAYCVLIGTAFFFVFGAWALSGAPLTGIPIIDMVLVDQHYKYLVPLSIPWTAYFVIANWVGFQYYRNS
ncbi:hypothetical protein FRB91_005847 [Serendipita sp. 411]|nr:hypothetical protein FRC18_008610 [Serendipita sp. 400]KAG8840641.1 hypothetical protein FRB91_005847 [Serendipita sp. 411]